jgi:arginine decarboxylase
MTEFGQYCTPLLDAITGYTQTDHAPFYTPGHKHGRGAAARLVELHGIAGLQADLPELPGLDHLGAPTGVIQAAQQLAAEAFGADRSWFLVNGSTGGVAAAMMATCQPGDKIVLPRNVHQSAIAGLILTGAVPLWLDPVYDAASDLAHGLDPTAITAVLAAHPDTKAVMIVHPTYYGVCSDVAAIAQICHAHNIPLLVDEAHGAHFAFHADLPQSALAAGADLVVQSIHKTLGAMTQAAMLHQQGQRVSADRVSQGLQLLQSSSPSYVLMASLDAARQQMATQGTALMTQTLQLADQARSRICQIPGLAVLSPEQAGSPGFAALDRTRLTVTVAQLGITGFIADEVLQDLGVIAELPDLRHLTFIVSLGNTATDIDRLVQALKTLSQKSPVLTQPSQASLVPVPYPSSGCSTPLLSPRQAFYAAQETVPIDQASDRISAELVCPYPPGIPILYPGERIMAPQLAHLQAVLKAGGMISGCADSTLKTLQVVLNQ